MGEISYEVLWIIAIVVFAVIEGAVSGLVSIWFAFGAFFALIATLLGAGALAQIIIFIAVSVLAFIFIRRWAKDTIMNKTEKTDIDRIIGKKVLITEKVDNTHNTGKAKINDLEWKVKSAGGEIIAEGEEASVERIEGVRLIVSKAAPEVK